MAWISWFEGDHNAGCSQSLKYFHLLFCCEEDWKPPALGVFTCVPCHLSQPHSVQQGPFLCHDRQHGIRKLLCFMALLKPGFYCTGMEFEWRKTSITCFSVSVLAELASPTHREVLLGELCREGLTIHLQLSSVCLWQHICPLNKAQGVWYCCACKGLLEVSAIILDRSGNTGTALLGQITSLLFSFLAVFLPIRWKSFEDDNDWETC